MHPVSRYARTLGAAVTACALAVSCAQGAAFAQMEYNGEKDIPLPETDGFIIEGCGAIEGHIILEDHAYYGQNIAPVNTTAGPDDALWFTSGWARTELYSMGKDGILQEHPLPPGAGSLGAVATGPDGNIWIALDNWRIAKMAPDGALTEYALPQYTTSNGWAVSPEGDLWFGSNSHIFGMTSTDGHLRFFDVPMIDGQRISYGEHAMDYGVDAEGNVWFTQEKIFGRMTPSGVFTLFDSPDGNAIVLLETDAAGTPWISTEHGIFAIDPRTGAPQRSFHPDEERAVESLTAGPDGSIWFSLRIAALETHDRLGRIFPDGSMRLYELPKGMRARVLAIASDDSVWMSGVAVLPAIKGDPDGRNGFLQRTTIFRLPCPPGPYRCGDGIREGRERCDDGNRRNGDGCSYGCTIEKNNGEARCGDTILSYPEACDGGHYCNADCTLAPPPPDATGLTSWGICEASAAKIGRKRTAEIFPWCGIGGICGDGRLNYPEACDDGNTEDGDGCSKACATEPPPEDWTAPSPEQWCRETVRPVLGPQAAALFGCGQEATPAEAQALCLLLGLPDCPEPAPSAAEEPPAPPAEPKPSGFCAFLPSWLAWDWMCGE